MLINPMCHIDEGKSHHCLGNHSVLDSDQSGSLNNIQFQQNNTVFIVVVCNVVWIEEKKEGW